MNTTATAAYTPLESLLLFQSLATYGTDHDAFVRISDLLKKNVLIKDDASFDPARLTPVALQELYSKLLRDELKSESAEGDSNGDGNTSRKRKLQSPPLPTTIDANNDQLPGLVDRLYGRYREYMLRLIREDEEQYEALTREIEQIERGDWDEKIANDDSTTVDRSASVDASGVKKDESESPKIGEVFIDGKEAATPSPSVAPKQALHQTKLQFPPTSAPPQAQSLSSTPQTASRTEGLVSGDALNTRPATPQLQKTAEQAPSLRNGSQAAIPTPAHQTTPSVDRPHGPSPLQPAHQRQPDNWKWEQYQAGPQQPAPYPPQNANYQQFPPGQYPAQYPPYPPPQRGSVSGPAGLGPPPPHARVPSSPLNPGHPNPIVPPPPNGARGPGSPAAPHLDQLANAAEQQYRASSGSPMMQQGPMPGAPYGHPYPGYPPPPAQYRDGRPPSGNGVAPQWNPQQYPPQPYPPPPNYGYPPTAPHGQRPFAPGPEILQTQPRQYNSPYNPSQGARPIQPSSAASTPKPRPRDSGILPQTPASFDRAFRTGRATAWTPAASPSTPKAPASIQHIEQGPNYEPLSPVLGPSKLTGKDSIRKSETSVSKRTARGGRTTQRGKAGSAVSSTFGRSHRSPSSSRPDELSLEAEGIRKVKQESSTPRFMDETGDTTADEGPSRRHKDVADTSSTQLKRKRQASTEPVARSSGPPTHVHWTRNFPKISASALERIGAHRNASTFALPIKERDAPGYKTLILRPQDLKSIRTSIVAGSKAGAAIAATMEDQGAPTITMPMSTDLIPPKGIVNNAQLEKELMLMFANAIMFNPDPNRGVGTSFESEQGDEEGAADGPSKYGFDENGIVNDTRAMFADVEKIMGDLRSAEVRSGDRVAAPEVEGEEDETDELGGGEPDYGGSIAKRRRRA